MKAAIMGYGTIGSGVYEVLDKNCKSVEKKAGEPIEVKYILDLREFPGSPVEKLVIHDVEQIVHGRNKTGLRVCKALPARGKACGDFQ